MRVTLRLFLGIIASILISHTACAASDRVALVIGNSNYVELGRLANTLNDAKSIESALSDIGFKTKLVVDSSETSLRKELRAFAIESVGASVAVVFYAGHGAQVNGENFILPIDFDIPKRESDIRLSGIKVDDVINAMQAKTKVVFLDACRDNPALLKSLAAGRGSYRGGLAAANGSALDSSSGGVFIAYATDAGNVAQDGDGQSNSPFTKALAAHIREPVSIDDMFSQVVREVRASTKNTQRPYKYASLDGVVCLTTKCGTDNAISAEAQTALASPSTGDGKNTVVVESRQPTGKSEALSKSDGWVYLITQISPKEFVYIDPASTKKIGRRTTARIKWVVSVDPAAPLNGTDAASRVQLYVTDCSTGHAGVAESQDFDSAGRKQSYMRYNAPEILRLEVNVSDQNSIGAALNRVLCQSEISVPIVQFLEIESSDWQPLYTIDAKKGIDFSYLKTSISRSEKYADVTVKIVYRDLIALSELRDGSPNDSSMPPVGVQIARDRFACSEKGMYLRRQDFFSKEGRLIAMTSFLNPEDMNPAVVEAKTPLGDFFDFICSN